MVAAPLAVFLLKGIASALNSTFGTLSYTINISIAMIGTLIVCGMLMISKVRKKDPRTGWKTVVLKEKDLRTLLVKVISIFIIKILFIILGIYFLVTYIRETDFLCLMIYLLAFACVIHFHQEFKTSRIKKILYCKQTYLRIFFQDICKTFLNLKDNYYIYQICKIILRGGL